MNFKDIIQNDLDIFFNNKEFSEQVVIDGRQIDVIISNHLRKDSKKFQPHMENNYSEGEKTFTMKSSDFIGLESYDTGDRIVIDEELFQVHKVTKDMGITHIEVKIHD